MIIQRVLSKIKKMIFVKTSTTAEVESAKSCEPVRKFSRSDFKFSAYLSVFNDWDILEPALKSMAQYIDELVVIDGAFQWMIPYLEGLGVDPSKSDERVYEAIRASGIPFRVINGTWKNEVEKRIKGYQECAHRFRYRIDADEVIFFNDDILDQFLNSNYAVAEMNMPIYLSPGWLIKIKDGDNSKFPNQCFLFDSNLINANQHLTYLWLVLTSDSLPESQVSYPVYPAPIAFNAHLTHWRTVTTAVNRGAFYVMNWMRQNGVPWLPSISKGAELNFYDLFAKIPAKKFKDSLLHGGATVAIHKPNTNECIARTPLSIEQEKVFEGLYAKFKSGLLELNQNLSAIDHHVMNGELICVDISSAENRLAISSHNNVEILFGGALKSASINLVKLRSNTPQLEEFQLPVSIEGDKISFSLPEIGDCANGYYRDVLEIKTQFDQDIVSQAYRFVLKK